MRRLQEVNAHFSLRVRLTVLAALGAALVLPVAALMLHGGLSAALDDALTAELRIRADDVAAEIEAGLPPIVGAPLLTQVVDTGGEVIVPAGAAALLTGDELAVARSGEVVVDRDVAEVGGPTRILARPVVAPTGEPLIVTVVGSTAPIARARHRLAVVLGIVWPVLVLVVAATAWILARAALRPVRRMTRRAETISLEGPDARLPQPPGSDEIAELGTTLNGMLERISETVAHERAFVDDASHELRSPIAVLRGELEMARLELTDGGDRALWVAAIDSAIEETDRLSRVTDRLLVLAHADAGRLADQLMPVRLLEATVREADRLHVDGVRIDVTGTEVEVMADPDLLAQLISNLLTNAARFADRRVLAEVGGDGAMLVVADDGPGFAPGFVDRALDRFSRGEPSRTRGRGGAGLGLAIVAAIADAFDGRIALANGGPLGGAVVGLDLPRAEPTG